LRTGGERRIYLRDPQKSWDNPCRTEGRIILVLINYSVLIIFPSLEIIVNDYLTITH